MNQNNGRSRLARSFLPPTTVLELTYRCNHRCLFCCCPWEAANGGFERLPELARDEWKECMRMLVERGVSMFAFSGGEALLNPHAEELIEYGASLQAEHVETRWTLFGRRSLRSWRAPPHLYLLTNGRAMRPDILRLCRKHEVKLGISLPGLTTYEYHTGFDGADVALHWFSEARKARIRTVVGITVTKRNLFELRATIAAAFKAGARMLLLNRFLPGGRGLSHVDELLLTPEQIPEMLDVGEEMLRRYRREGVVGTELPKCLIDKSRYKRLTVGTQCSAALEFFAVGPCGHLRLCNHSPVRLAHYTRMDEVKQHPYWRRFIRKDYLPAACRGCADVADCDGGCREAAHLVCGEVDGLDPALARSDVLPGQACSVGMTR